MAPDPEAGQTHRLLLTDGRPGESRATADMRRRYIQKLASCLYHSKIDINIASTMAIDGAIFDRPQIAPAYDDSPNSVLRADLPGPVHADTIRQSPIPARLTVYSRDEFI